MRGAFFFAEKIIIDAQIFCKQFNQLSHRLEIRRRMIYNRAVLVAERGKGGRIQSPRKGVEDMRVIVFIIRVTLLTGAILLLLSKTAA